MERIAYSLSCLVFAVALVLAGPGGAGPAKGVVLVELCAGDSASQIWIDAEGNPVDLPMHGKCLDCLLFAVPLPDVVTGRLTLDPPRLPMAWALSITPHTYPVTQLRHLPRGPPAAAGEVLSDGHLRPLCRSIRPLAASTLDFHQGAEPDGVTDVRAIP